ncbi:MAG: amidase [Alphaproteobacteria bacterium]|nr:amidase [Alphaproteobacteria bacterium]
MSEMYWLEAGEAARLIAAKKLSPVELTKALLARIEKYDGGLNAFLTLRPEQSLADAKAAEDAVMRGDDLGPLHGVPYALKDIIDAEGWPTTAHSRLLADNVATADAPVTAKLRAAGGILMGKLSTHEFALGGPSFDLPWPPARNAWGRNYSPGGSSSGSGAAVAAGFVPIALGSDTGGSVRNPASMNGLLGMKATYGRVSRRGVVPLSFSLDHVGPLTRTTADNALALSVIAGHDPQDPGSAEQLVSDMGGQLGRGVKGLKIGVIRHFYTKDLIADPETTAAIEAAIKVLEGLGAEIREIETRPLAQYAACNRVILLSEACAIHEKWITERTEDYGALLLGRLLPGMAYSGVDYVQATRTRARYAAEFNEHFNSLDAVVTVNNMEPAFLIEDFEAGEKHYPRQARTPFNVTGNPAVAVPTGFSSSGLPLSMQIVTGQFDEAMGYRIAAAYEAETGWTGKHPDLDVTAVV